MPPDPTPDPEQSAPTVVAKDAARSGFQFDRIAVIKTAFEELPRESIAEGETQPPRLDIGLRINARINMRKEVLGAMVTLDVEVTPNPKWQPYKIQVFISGEFTAFNVSREHFDNFCRVAVPPILFPYIRESIHRMTMDGRFGSVRLDPVNLSDLLGKANWDVNPTAESTVSPSSEPEQPSVQSPSASPE